MAIFRDIAFTPAEFARLANIDKKLIEPLEKQNAIQTTRRKIGSSDRKVIPLESVQNFFVSARNQCVVATATAIQENAVSHEAPMPTTTTTETNTVDRIAAATTTQSDATVAAANTTEPALTTGTGAISAGPALPVHLFPLKPKYKTQMFYNVKGGTGKSTLAAQCIMQAAMMGYRVLGIDLDGQGHLSVNLDVLNAHELPTIYDVLINDLPIEQAIINVAPGLDLIAGNLGLCNIEIPLNQKPRREYRLSEALKKIADQYDLMIADTNPAASILNSSMLVAADVVNVVCATNPLSFHGMSLVLATIGEMEKEFGRKLQTKIIPNLYDNREVISQEVLGELRAEFGENCTQAVVSRSVDINEATKRRTTVWAVNSKGISARDISTLTKELIF